MLFENDGQTIIFFDMFRISFSFLPTIVKTIKILFSLAKYNITVFSGEKPNQTKMTFIIFAFFSEDDKIYFIAVKYDLLCYPLKTKPNSIV